MSILNSGIASGLRSMAATSAGASTITGVVNINQGGTGATTFTQGSVIFAGASALSQNNTNFFWDDTNVRFKIGTVNQPVNGNTVPPRVVIGGSNILGSMQIVRWSNPGGGGAQFFLSSTRGADVNDYTAVVPQDGLGVLAFLGADGGTQFAQAGYIIGAVDGAVAPGSVAGRMTFGTAPPAGSTAERMRIDSVGKVGIGTFIGGGTLISMFEVVDPSSGTTRGIFNTMYNSSASAPRFMARKARGSSFGGATNVLNGDFVGSFAAAGFKTDGTFSAETGAMAMQAEEDYTATNLGTGLRFFTVPIASTTLTEQLRLTNNGTPRFSGTSTFSANASVATLLGSAGCSGARTSVQKWLSIQDSGATTYFIPCF